MAVRLNVMILSPGGGSHFQAQCDDCIGQLLGRPGLDVTLLERLPSAGESTTEALALESMGGHIACLAWQDPDSVVSRMAAAGKPVIRRAHTHDPAPPTVEPNHESSGAKGRMFLFDMRRSDLNSSILPALQSLLKRLQVSTFQIAGGTTSRTPLQKTQPIRSIPPVSAASSKVVHEAKTSLDESAALDRLIDQLDELD